MDAGFKKILSVGGYYFGLVLVAAWIYAVAKVMVMSFSMPFDEAHKIVAADFGTKSIANLLHSAIVFFLLSLASEK